jgi:aryl-alcohol dehydrogenase-like predicted oxidoreductase
VEDSLQRLRTDYIDLYQSHCDDPDTPMEETLAAYGQLIQQGKIRVIGASNFGAERLLQSLQVSQQKGYPSYQSLQPFYNLYDRAEYETKLEPLCREKGLSVISYFSLASGFLTGKYRSEKDLAGSARGQRVGKYLNERGFRVLEALDRVARERGAAPATVSLAWLMARPGITAPIASATSLEQLRHLVKAPELELDHSEIEMLNQASAYET